MSDELSNLDLWNALSPEELAIVIRDGGTAAVPERMRFRRGRILAGLALVEQWRREETSPHRMTDRRVKTSAGEAA